VDAGFRREPDNRDDPLGRSRPHDGGGEDPDILEERPSVWPQRIRAVPRRNVGAEQETTRTEAVSEEREIRAHARFNVADVFKGRDRSRIRDTPCERLADGAA